MQKVNGIKYDTEDGLFKRLFCCHDYEYSGMTEWTENGYDGYDLFYTVSSYQCKKCRKIKTTIEIKPLLW